jgi:hypothetical protein
MNSAMSNGFGNTARAPMSLPIELLTAHVGEHQVEHDRARLDRERAAEGVLSVERGDRLEALVGDRGHEHAARVRVVLDDEHALGKATLFADAALQGRHPATRRASRPCASDGPPGGTGRTSVGFELSVT